MIETQSSISFFRRHEHDATVAPFGNRVACPLVIADGLLDGTSRLIDNVVQQIVICGDRRFELSLGWSFLVHALSTVRAIGTRREAFQAIIVNTSRLICPSVSATTARGVERRTGRVGREPPGGGKPSISAA